jgi:hypothetical protein
VKARVWEALISKEESRLSEARQQVEALNNQRQRILERIDYIATLMAEYA